MTGSSHSFEVSSPGTSTEMWLNQEFGWAPCQCLTLAGMMTTSPGFNFWTGLPAS